jgi:hypothetical protein
MVRLEKKRDMGSRYLTLTLVVSLLLVVPAHAYGDPTGGVLFRSLAPMLALLWGIWMIVANTVRRWIANVARKLRGIDADEPTS